MPGILIGLFEGIKYLGRNRVWIARDTTRDSERELYGY